VLAGVLVVVALIASPDRPAFATPTPAAGSPSALFAFADSRITESSGLAVSSLDGTVFTHNDSGDAARIFRVDAHGNTVAVYTLRGATNIDWEDMATGSDANGKPVLYIGDIGDNNSDRKDISVYRLAEPSGPSADVSWMRFRFAYPDGAHDAEALLVDPRTGRLFIGTKSLLGGRLYEAPSSLSTNAVNMLVPGRSLPPLVTSGAFSPDGTRIVLLTYLNAYWAAGATGTLHAFGVPLQRQDEAIAFTPDGKAVLVGSEGLHSTVYRVPLPDIESAGPSRPSSTLPSAPARKSASSVTSDPATTTIELVVLVLPVIGAGLLGAYWRRRSRGRSRYLGSGDQQRWFGERGQS
jgi:DNA-binding beta-propeller fold protein YncE